MSHNVHNILHIISDVEYMGTLDKFSAFPFENMLQKIKNLIRKGDNPLAQVVKRISEINKSSPHIFSKIQSSSKITYKKFHERGPLLPQTNSPQFEEIVFKTFTLKIFEHNNCCVLKDGKYQEKKDLFSVPCKSSDLQIYVVSKSGPLQVFPLKEVSFKCVKLFFKDDYVVLPLQHTDENE
ncbi:hypothetical protein NQ317_016266 [Molorchus minor]|uniref:Uncharacterized protein n=1 Tax=Molorchus minor TaxID=1323400 RepID=A0ABQ9K0Q1_9CUCU|nr:hypothetical protein NQ317_016266 [Molorchus minor]